MSSFVVKMLRPDGEEFLREVHAEDVLPLAKINDLPARSQALWAASWDHPDSGGAVADTDLDVASDDSWLDLFEFAEYVLDSTA